MLRIFLYTINITAFLIMMNISCSEVIEKAEFPPYFSTETREINFIGDGEEKTIALTTTVPWEAHSSEEWLTIEPSKGAYNTNITITAKKNDSSGPRSATLSLIPESGDEIIIEISQEKIESMLTTDIQALSLSPYGEDKLVYINSNTSWNAVSNDDWLSITPTDGNNDQTIILKASKNESDEQRTASVTLTTTDGDKVVVIEVIQPNIQLLVPGSDFEDWDLFMQNNQITTDSELALLSQSPEGTGMDGGRALAVKGNIRAGNPTIIKFKVPENFSLEGKSRVVFYVKGTALDRIMSINWYKPNGINYYTFTTGDILTEDKLRTVTFTGDSPDDNAGNSYNGIIDTDDKWVKISLVISDLPFGSSTTEGGNLIQFRAGGAYSAAPVVEFDILIDNITLE